MSLEKPLDEINETDLAALITSATPELKTLEYKETLPGTSDSDRKEFFADVSSFANSSGGHLIYGMRANEGVPIELTGLSTGGDAAILSLENAIRDGIAPRIGGIHCRSVTLANSRTAIVMRIAKSFGGPHMVKFRGASRFYARTSNGKYQLDVDEIRTAFLGSATTAERIRNFRLDRISHIRGRETPIPLRLDPCVVIHAIPLNSLDGAAYDVLSLKKNASIHQLLAPPFRSFANSVEVNFDGILAFEGDRREPTGGYSQLYRKGIIEGVDTTVIPFNERRGVGKVIASQSFEEGLFRTIHGYLLVLKLLAVDMPVLLTLALTDVKGYTMATKSDFFGKDRGAPFDRDILMPQDILVETYEPDVSVVLKPLVEEIWNAAGIEESPHYRNGQWVGYN